MNKLLVIFTLLIISTFVVGCSETVEPSQIDEPLQESNQPEQQIEVADDNSNVEETESQVEIEEDKGFFVDKVTITSGDNDVSGEVKKYKATKTAEIEMRMTIADEDETADPFFEGGDRIDMAPMLINMMCKFYAMGVFDEEAFQQWKAEWNEEYGSGDSSGQEEESIRDIYKLEDYTVTKTTIVFEDDETGERIAKCVATGAEREDVKFTVDREYEHPFFGVSIGEYKEE